MEVAGPGTRGKSGCSEAASCSALGLPPSGWRAEARMGKWSLTCPRFLDCHVQRSLSLRLSQAHSWDGCGDAGVFLPKFLASLFWDDVRVSMKAVDPLR